MSRSHVRGRPCRHPVAYLIRYVLDSKQRTCRAAALMSVMIMGFAILIGSVIAASALLHPTALGLGSAIIASGAGLRHLVRRKHAPAGASKIGAALREK